MTPRFLIQTLMRIRCNRLVLPAGIAIALLFPSCATQVAPSGGPVDTEPPRIIETRPLQGTTRFHDNKVTFTFDEYVDHASFQQAVHISPLQAGTVKFDWSGKSVTVYFPDTLRPNHTYVVSVGTDVKDVHAGNKLAQTVNLAFATGDSLDKGAFGGRVFHSDQGNVSLFAYLLDGRSADTLDPARVRPDYVNQTAADGSFKFTNIAEGRYRVFAVRDNQKNFLYDVESDDIGISPDSSITVTATDSGITSAVYQRFRLIREDTTAPYLQTVEAATDRTIQLKFNEDIRTDSSLAGMFAVIDSASGTPVPLAGLRRVPDRKFSYVLYLNGGMHAGTYFFEPRILADLHGNLMRVRTPFTGTAAKDTARPVLLATIPARDQQDFPIDSTLRITFSTPQKSGAIVRMSDSAKTDVPLEVYWQSPFDAVARHQTLESGNKYQVRLDLRTFRDSLTDRSAGDSVYAFSFVARETPVGSMSGIVADARDSLADAIVDLVPVDPKAPRKKTATRARGGFSFDKVPQGNYVLDAYKHAPGRTDYDGGRSWPFRPAMRFSLPSDTLRIRAGWETQNVRVVIP